MIPFAPSSSPISSLTILLIFLSISDRGAKSATFTLISNCGDTIWPGILSNSGSPSLETTGFALASGESRSLSAPSGWSGRFWARTSCSSDSSGRLICATGDCGSGSIECGGASASPPATLAEFTLSSFGGKDFYDVSLVDGYNLPMLVSSSACETTGCAVDLNPMCPTELRTAQGEACRSACDAFGRPEYCCSGDFGSPSACRPTVYSQMFKSACPRAYSYAYDDASSTFTCVGGDYSITFCPEASQSLKSTRTSPSPPSDEATGLVVEGDSWLASLAMGEEDSATSAGKRSSSITAVNVSFFVFFCVLLL